jgi:hypothetical protein
MDWILKSFFRTATDESTIDDADDPVPITCVPGQKVYTITSLSNSRESTFRSLDDTVLDTFENHIEDLDEAMSV